MEHGGPRLVTQRRAHRCQERHAHGPAGVAREIFELRPGHAVEQGSSLVAPPELDEQQRHARTRRREGGRCFIDDLHEDGLDFGQPSLLPPHPEHLGTEVRGRQFVLALSTGEGFHGEVLHLVEASGQAHAEGIEHVGVADEQRLP